MPIPEFQLGTWSHQGATTTAKTTYKSIQNALDSATGRLAKQDFEVYLQGSYKNTTNIRGDSDVDIVCQLNKTFGYDTSSLTESEKRLFNDVYSTATYTCQNFRRDCLSALTSHYGTNLVTEANKCLRVSGNSGRLDADVVVCLQYRKYASFQVADEDYVEGIKFYTRHSRRKIINYPKPHYHNGVCKNARSRTDRWFKRVVRMYKNARTWMVNHDIISTDLAPSYFLECLLYNVPDEYFGKSYQDTYENTLAWLCDASLGDLICQNEQLSLFGSSPEQWSTDDAQEMLIRFVTLWNNWS